MAAPYSKHVLKHPLPLALSLIVFILHAVGNPHYGFFIDELYFIMCGTRPDWGYVDQPPLTPLLAAASQTFGHSLILLRSIPALFAAGSVWIACRLALELGGGAFAQILAALTTFFCPVLMAFGMKLSTDTAGLFLWPLAALLLVRVLKTGNARVWPVVGITLGIAFQSKYSVCFFSVALLVGLLLNRQYKVITSWWWVGGILIATLIALPNMIWQWSSHFPMLELLKNGQHGKNVILSPRDFLLSQLLITNPALSLIWVSGLVWYLASRRFRCLGFAYVILMIEMIALHGKHYYSANYYPILFAAGGVAIESWIHRTRVLRLTVVTLTILFGILMVPYVMPVLPVKTFIKYQAIASPILHMQLSKTENFKEGPLPQDWADMHGWRELTATVAQVYKKLSPDDKSKALILTRNYGQAAAIEFFGGAYGLPPVISGHNQYYLWGLHGRKGEVLIDVSGNCAKRLHLYKSSLIAAIFTHPYVMPNENNIPIRICRYPMKSLQEIWPKLKIYE